MRDMKWRTPLVVLACGTVVLLISFGTRTSFGIFLKPVSDTLGWGREVFAMAMAIQNLVWGLAQPFAGALADRFGAGRVVATASAVYAFGIVLMSVAASPLDFTLGAGVMVGLGLSGTSFPIVLAVVGRAAPARRQSLYLGIAAAGGSSGQLLVVPLGQAAMTAWGWPAALALLALLCLAMAPLAAALAGRALHDPTLPEQAMGAAIKEAGGHGGYWFLTAGFFVCGFHVAFIGTHLPAFIVDQGEAPALGALALMLIGLGNIAGSYLAGALGGRFSKKYLLSGLYFARSLVITAFVVSPVSEVSIMVFALAIGVLWLSTVPLTSGLVAQIFGVRYLATLFGFVFFSHQVGAFLGVWLGGYLFDLTGSYEGVWWIAVGLGLAAAALHFPINERPVARLVSAAR